MKVRHSIFLLKNISIWDFLFIFVTLLFFIVAYILSIYAHETFRTYAKDMGLYNQYVYLFSHFKYPASTVYLNKENGLFFLSDHATFILPIECMFYWIMGKNALLYLQITYMMLGALGLYKLVALQFNKKYYAFFVSLLYYLHYSLYNALSFDFHVNILAASIIPWLLFFYFKSNNRKYYILTIIMLLVREDTALYLIMLSIFLFYSDHRKPKLIFFTACVSLVYFIGMYKIILPMFNVREDVVIANWRYSEIGNSVSEIILKFVNEPAWFLEKLLDTPEKRMKINYLLFSGAFLFPFLHWKYVLIILPTIAITCYSNDWIFWGNFGHYNIMFSVWMPYVIIAFITKFNNKLFQVIFGMFFLYQYVSLNVNNYLEPVTWTRITKIFYKEYYYERYNLKEIKEAISLIPENASVSASSCLVPHLAFREKIYYFPDVFNAEYIAFIESDCIKRYYYFPNPSSCYYEVEKYKNNKKYKVIYDKNSVCVLKRNY